jgi:hypothetical protein
VVAFLVSLLLSLAMVAIIVRVGRNRPVGTPLTWGEAFGASVFVFFLLFLLYGVVPHQWLAWADNELGWRSDTVGIPLGPLGPVAKLFTPDSWENENLLFPQGIPLPNGYFVVTAQVLRDIIAATLYIAFLVAQIVMWLWWQKRDQKKPDQAELTSAYGRPLVRGS